MSSLFWWDFIVTGRLLFDCLHDGPKDAAFLFVASQEVFSLFGYAKIVEAFGHELEGLLFFGFVEGDVFPFAIADDWEIGVEVIVFGDHDQCGSFYQVIVFDCHVGIFLQFFFG